MDGISDQDYSEEIRRYIEANKPKGQEKKNTSSDQASKSRATPTGEGQGIRRAAGGRAVLPDSQQPNVNGYRSPDWWKRELYPWQMYPGPSEPRISIVKVEGRTIEFRWWVEPCAELEAGHEDECPGYILEHMGSAGATVKQKECPLHGFRWRRSYLSPTEKQQEVEGRLRAAAIPDLFHAWSFYTYPRKDQGAYEAVMEYASAGKVTQSLMLVGPYGTGKTSLAVSVIQKRIQEHGERALFTNVATLFEEIKALFGRDNESSALISRVMNVPHLVLDDLGAERATEWVQSNLYNILNYRLTNNKPTIVTTNLDMQDLIEQLGQRTVERLKKPYYRVIHVGGVSLRDG